MILRFLATINKFDSTRLTAYVPRKAIEFYLPGADLERFSHASWTDDIYKLRLFPGTEYYRVGGYLGYYSARNTLRLVFDYYASDKKELIGKLAEFVVIFDLNQDFPHATALEKVQENLTEKALNDN